MSASAAPPKPDIDVEVETKEEVREQLAPLWRVICHDDPHTTMEFVVEVLRGVFRLTTPRAMEVMYQVHHAGAALVGRWPEEAARKKVNRATAKARAQGFPLTFTVEEDD
jgi:ATP-dependent Clp protease adaptor protein ClpS